MSCEPTALHRRQEILNISVGGYSSKGLKPTNQDSFAARNDLSGSALEYKGITACLADGVSCSSNGQNASQTSVSQFIDDYYSTSDSWSVKESSARVLMSLNSWLHHHSQQDNLQRGDGWITTFSAAIFKSTTAHILHAGDSRIYCFRGGQLEQLTRDHCTSGQGRETFLSRALGLDSHLEIDYLQHPVQLGDIYMLSSDGIHDWLSDADIRQSLAQYSPANTRSLESVASHLVQQALAAGSDDNCSCLLLHIDSLPSADMSETRQQLAELTIPPVMSVGHRIDHYLVLKQVYSSSRSHLYLVEDLNDETRYLLKAPSLNCSEDKVMLEGFILEQWVGQRLSHPGVMKIFPRPSRSPFLYHLCEFIEGITLRQWMNDNPQAALEAVRDINSSIIRSIRAFERMGMVHRDLKPENIMINTRGQAVIIDFGSVKVDSLGELRNKGSYHQPMGDLDYTAPECLLGSAASHRSDIFSLGVIVYEMLAGERPFKSIATGQQANPNHHWVYQPLRDTRPDLPLWLNLCLEKACQPKLKQRYTSLSEFETDLKQANQEMMRSFKKAPLIVRKPVAVWQLISAALLLVLLIQSWMILQPA